MRVFWCPNSLKTAHVMISWWKGKNFNFAKLSTFARFWLWLFSGRSSEAQQDNSLCGQHPSHWQSWETEEKCSQHQMLWARGIHPFSPRFICVITFSSFIWLFHFVGSIDSHYGLKMSLNTRRRQQAEICIHTPNINIYFFPILNPRTNWSNSIFNFFYQSYIPNELMWFFKPRENCKSNISLYFSQIYQQQSWRWWKLQERMTSTTPTSTHSEFPKIQLQRNLSLMT